MIRTRKFFALPFGPGEEGRILRLGWVLAVFSALKGEEAKAGSS